LEFNRLLQEIREGREEALKLYYGKYREDFLSWGRQHFDCDIPTLMDVYQSSWIVLYRKIVSGELKNIEISIEKYIFGICWRLLIRHKKVAKRVIYREDLSTITELTDDPLLTTIISDELNQEMKTLLRTTIDNLGEPCKKILTLFYFDGYDIEEITAELQYPNKNTTSVMKARCLTRLKELIKKPIYKFNQNI
jgi:RNA polymerase sigma-70 factor (ECF subfamily)